MVWNRILKSAVVVFLTMACSLSVGCSKSPSGSSDVGFACESDPIPARVGLNTFTVTLTGAAATGERVTGAHISLEGDMSHPGMSPVFSEAREVAPGRYQGALELNMLGDWTVLFHAILPDGRRLDRQIGIRNIQAM